MISWATPSSTEDVNEVLIRSKTTGRMMINKKVQTTRRMIIWQRKGIVEANPHPQVRFEDPIVLSSKPENQKQNKTDQQKLQKKKKSSKKPLNRQNRKETQNEPF